MLIKFRNLLKKKLVSFGRDGEGSVAVEMVFILPIFAMFTFLTYDAGTIYTQYKRATRHYYAVGDLMSSVETNLTCSRLDKMSQLVYESYAEGNWARRPGSNNNNFPVDGALDFTFSVRAIRVIQDPADASKTQGLVEWVYFRSKADMDNNGTKKPGDITFVPGALRDVGTGFVQIRGELFVAPAMNYLGVFDPLVTSQSQPHKKIVINRYFPMRFVPFINLVEGTAADDLLDEKCWNQSKVYPSS